ncbi:nucleoprotein [Saint-Floris virus]|uniref:Nucleoprotein n=1 Tax=Saint-Floris virus TaxID=2847279 RepID=R4I3M0_9VIRU|nr:nucleoprotein [Saint-Floris virus]AFH89001.1 nucleoprotein [Saint-Floris virus]
MLSQVVQLRKWRKRCGKEGASQRFYTLVNCSLERPRYKCSFIDGSLPVEVHKHEIAYDSRPTLNHFLIKKQFPKILGVDCISQRGTRQFTPLLRELFSESIHQLKRGRCEFILSALRWPTGVPCLQFIEFYMDEMFIYFPDETEVNKYITLIGKASGYPYSTIEDQIVILYKKILLEGQKLGLTAMDLPGVDLVMDICVVQAARCAARLTKRSAINDPRYALYLSAAPSEFVTHYLQRKRIFKEGNKWLTLSCLQSYEQFMRHSPSFRRTALSTFWVKDWPTLSESNELYKTEHKRQRRDRKVTKWLPASPNFF